ncbi:uncharacterized protein [Eurosta solidaginis]|uniref:uncharacterized protein n=1 Tax=Eurosta solidaginis TaxID=178769 RepID=UPI003530A898
MYFSPKELTINSEINRYVNRLLQQIGPAILGTALNPNSRAGQRTNNTATATPKNNDEDSNSEVYFNDDVDIVGTDGSADLSGETEKIPEIEFQPDPEFEHYPIRVEIDGIVNRIIGQVIRVAGPSLLPALLGNNRPTTESSNFDADFEDDDDSSSNDINPKDVDSVFSKTDANAQSGSNGEADDATRVNIALPTFAPESGEVTPTTTTTDPLKKVSYAQVGGGEKATNVGTQSTSTTTTRTTAIITTVKPTTISSTTTKSTTGPQTTTEITTTTTSATTSKPMEIPTTASTTSTTTTIPASSTSIPTSTTTTTISTPKTTTTPPTPIITTTVPIITTTIEPSTFPATTIDAILVIPRNKGQSRSSTNRNRNNNNTTQQPTTIVAETQNSFTRASTKSPDVPTTTYSIPTNSPTISNILNTTTDTLPTPSIPATYLGTFDSGLEEQQL